MYRIIDSRSSGKTSRLMLLAKENNGVIVCRNPEIMKRKAQGYGIIGIEFISYGQYMRNQISSDKKYFIDEIEAFVKTITPGELYGYTLSEE